MTLRLMDTMSRRKVVFEPRDPPKVSMYVCGPTVYNHIHIGNARAFIVFDVIRRYLSWRGYDVEFVMNYTDIDDKIIQKASEEGVEPQELALEYGGAFEAAMVRLEVKPPDVLVKATEHLTEMKEMISALIDKGYAYQTGGNVWFSVERFDGYGKLSGRTPQTMRPEERVEPDPSKKDPADFALWKAAKEGEPSWPSPWGDGRPGWHIECSAMSLLHLGMGFDIHGGGSDLIFPHHENEIAQAEASSGEAPFVRYWLHNGMVLLEEEKMSKSLGNFVLLNDFLEEVGAPVIRLMAIGGHYRSDVSFGQREAESAKRVLERWSIFANAGRELDVADPDQGSIESFTEAMDDDFNTPAAIGVVHDAVRRGNAAIAAGRNDEAAAFLAAFESMTEVLGIQTTERPSTPALIDELLELVVDFREKARADGRYAEADEIRDRLLSMGVVLEDTSGGARWRLR